MSYTQVGMARVFVIMGGAKHLALRIPMLRNALLELEQKPMGHMAPCIRDSRQEWKGGYGYKQTEHDTHELGPYDFDAAESAYEAIRQSHGDVEEIAWMMGSVALTPIR